MGNSIKSAASKAADLRSGNTESNRKKNCETDQDLINRINAENIAGGPVTPAAGRPDQNATPTAGATGGSPAAAPAS